MCIGYKMHPIPGQFHQSNFSLPRRKSLFQSKKLKMKVFQTLAFVAAVIAATVAAPAQSPRADWPLVGQKAFELETLVKDSLEYILNQAMSDNINVGQRLAAKLDAARTKAAVILEEAKELIEDQTLTVPVAEEKLKALEEILLQLQQDVQPELAELSPQTQTNIRDKFAEAYLKSQALAEEIYAALEASPRSGILADWPLVGQKAFELETLVKDSLEYILNQAMSDNINVGQRLAAKLDAARTKAGVILEEAKALIESQTLTVPVAEEKLKALEEILLQLQQDVQPELAELSPTTQTNIRDKFAEAYLKSQALAEEIYAALEATPLKSGILADWPKVEQLAGQIETLVRTSLESIKTTANNDNPQVGEHMAEHIDEAADDALAILGPAMEKIATQTLTRAEAETALKALEEILLTLQADLQHDISQLSAIAQNNIRQTFQTAYTQAQALAQQLYDAIDAPGRGVFANWPLVSQKVSELESNVRSALEVIRTTANNDNPQVGATIGEKLDAVAAEALMILAEVHEKIADESLTRMEAETILKGLEETLLALQADLQEDLAQLSPIAQNGIRQTFESAYNRAKIIAEEIYAAIDA